MKTISTLEPFQSLWSAERYWSTTVCSFHSRNLFQYLKNVSIKKKAIWDFALLLSQKRLTTNWRNVQSKSECPVEGNSQVNNVVCKCDVIRPLPNKVHLGLAEGEWKSCFYNQKLHLHTRDITTRQHFQVTCGTWEVFQVKHLTLSGLFWDAYHTQISQRNGKTGK